MPRHPEGPFIDPQDIFAEVDEFARKRVATHGDLYGWAPLSELGEPPTAVLFVSEKADPTVFPEQIGIVRILLKPISAPEPHLLDRR
jgi:hypothetical protein